MPTIDPRVLVLHAGFAKNKDADHQHRLCSHTRPQIESCVAQRSGGRGTRICKTSDFGKRRHIIPVIRQQIARGTVKTRAATVIGCSGTRLVKVDSVPMVRLEVTADGLARVVVDKTRHAAWQSSYQLEPLQSASRAHSFGDERKWGNQRSYQKRGTYGT